MLFWTCLKINIRLFARPLNPNPDCWRWLLHVASHKRKIGQQLECGSFRFLHLQQRSTNHVRAAGDISFFHSGRLPHVQPIPNCHGSHEVASISSLFFLISGNLGSPVPFLDSMPPTRYYIVSLSPHLCSFRW